MRVQGELAPGTMVGTLTSDLVHLIEGAQRVVVVPPRTEVKLAHSLKDSVRVAEMPHVASLCARQSPGFES
jgi:hypothetical protein